MELVVWTSGMEDVRAKSILVEEGLVVLVVDNVDVACLTGFLFLVGIGAETRGDVVKDVED